MRILLMFFAVSCVMSFAYAQNNGNDQKLDRSIREWTNLKSDSVVSIEYRFVFCERNIGFDQELIQLKITNKTNQVINVTWHSHQFYNDVCKTCDFPDEYTYSISLDPLSSKEGDCSLQADNRLVIFSKFVDSGYKGNQELTAFELHNITVEITK